MFQTILVSLKICLVHIFFRYIQYLERKVGIEEMFYQMHMLYRAMSEQNLEGDGKCVKDILYSLILLEFVERDTDELLLRIHFFRQVHGEVIDRSAVHQGMIRILH